MSGAELDAYDQMLLVKSGKLYLTSHDEGYPRIHHVRDYLRYALSVVGDVHGEILVWVPSRKNVVQEQYLFHKYDGHKIKLILSAITADTLVYYRRLVFIYLAAECRPVPYGDDRFVHANLRVKYIATEKRRRENERLATTGVRRLLPYKEPIVDSEGSRPQEEKNFVGLEEIVPVAKSPLVEVLEAWNLKLRLDPMVLVPHRFQKDLDLIVTQRYVYLLVHLLSQSFIAGRQEEINSFVQTMFERENYRKLHKTAQSLLPIAVKTCIQQIRATNVHNRSYDSAALDHCRKHRR